jgi:hypothetical protein
LRKVRTAIPEIMTCIAAFCFSPAYRCAWLALPALAVMCVVGIIKRKRSPQCNLHQGGNVRKSIKVTGKVAVPQGTDGWGLQEVGAREEAIIIKESLLSHRLILRRWQLPQSGSLHYGCIVLETSATRKILRRCYFVPPYGGAGWRGGSVRMMVDYVIARWYIRDSSATLRSVRNDIPPIGYCAWRHGKTCFQPPHQSTSLPASPEGEAKCWHCFRFIFLTIHRDVGGAMSARCFRTSPPIFWPPA